MRALVEVAVRSAVLGGEHVLRHDDYNVDVARLALGLAVPAAHAPGACDKDLGGGLKPKRPLRLSLQRGERRGARERHVHAALETRHGLARRDGREGRQAVHEVVDRPQKCLECRSGSCGEKRGLE